LEATDGGGEKSEVGERQADLKVQECWKKCDDPGPVPKRGRDLQKLLREQDSSNKTSLNKNDTSDEERNKREETKGNNFYSFRVVPIDRGRKAAKRGVEKQRNKRD